MTDKKRKKERNIIGIVKVVGMLTFDEGLRESFLADPGETLEDLGVEVKDKKLLKKLSIEIKRFIEKEILVADEGLNLGGSGIEPTPTVRPYVVPTNVVTPVVVSDLETPGDPWRKVKVDFGRITMLEKNALTERRIRVLQKQLEQLEQLEQLDK
jgi:hypothetical protein